MLKFSAALKNKVDLNDYDWRRDIENRLLMSHFTVFDVEVLEEILHSSLQIQLPTLANALEADLADVCAVVDKLSQTGLVKRSGDIIAVDKEMRKYYEFQILKFDDRFKPNMDFLQGLLAKVPIHALPNWYSVPRTSTNIFQSLLEKYLLTPRIYQRYLLELNYGDPVVTGIMEDVFSAPDYKLLSRDLREKYHLSPELFEEYMLHLEFNFICCLSYRRIGNEWKEVVTPFYEWMQYMRFKRDTVPVSIADEESQKGKIVCDRPFECAFATDLAAILKECARSPLPVAKAPAPLFFSLSDSSFDRLIRGLPDWPAADSERRSALNSYIGWILQKLSFLGLVAIKDEFIVTLEAAREWDGMAIHDLALNILRHPRNRFISIKLGHQPRSDRHLREVERALSRAIDLKWVLFEDFMHGVSAPVRGAEEVVLKKIGRQWEYVRPQYSPEQIAFIRASIFERFFEAGFVMVGSHDGRDCFAITPFGKAMLSLP